MLGLFLASALAFADPCCGFTVTNVRYAPPERKVWFPRQSSCIVSPIDGRIRFYNFGVPDPAFCQPPVAEIGTRVAEADPDESERWLIWNSAEGNLDTVRALLQAGVDPNGRDSGWSPLAAAMSSSDAPVAAMLKHYGGEMTREDWLNFARTWRRERRLVLSQPFEPAEATWLLARAPIYSDVVEHLLDQGADPRGDGDQSPLATLRKLALHADIDEERLSQSVRLLVERGAPLDADTFETLLQQRPDDLEWALAQGADPNGLTSDGEVPLTSMYHHEADALKIGRLLLDHGADPNFVTPDGRTPLHGVRSFEYAQLLIDHGARVQRTTTADGEPAPSVLETAWVCPKTARLLVERGASVQRTGATVERPWGKLVGCRDHTAASLCLELGIRGTGALHFAKPEMLESLLESGLNDPNEHYQDVPVIARWLDSDELDGLRLLLAHGADPDARIGKTTALILAVQEGREAVAHALLDAGADPNAADEFGRVAADYADRMPAVLRRLTHSQPGE